MVEPKERSIKSAKGMACLVCNGNAFSPLYAGLIRCDSCSFVTADVDASEEELQALYGQYYFNGDEYADYLGDKAVIQKNLRRWLHNVRKYTPGGKLLECGSAYGFFLELAQEHFDVLGYDVSEEAIRYANEVLKVPAKCQDFLGDHDLAPDSFDAVAMWDVVEHLDAPERFIERSGELLRDGGYLFLTTGDIDTWLPRRQGPRWRLIHPPTHLQYFSRKTISQLLNRKGFEVVRVSYPGYWRSIRQILHGMFVLGSQGKSSFIHGALRKLLPGRMGVYFNTFDIMLVTARKTSRLQT